MAKTERMIDPDDVAFFECSLKSGAVPESEREDIEAYVKKMKTALAEQNKRLNKSETQKKK